MVNKLTSFPINWAAIAMLVTAFTTGSAHAAESCGTDTQPCEMPRESIVIKRLTTSGIGRLAPGFKQSEHSCSQFKLSRNQVRNYLKSAGRISQNDMQYVTDESACVVTGAIRLADGKSYQFSIGELREGRLVSSADETEYLYCSKCTSPPFSQ